MSSLPGLRAGRDTDAAGFIDLIRACWGEYPGQVLDVDGEVPELRALATYFAEKGGALWAADHGGKVAGMVGTRPLGDGSWELCKMYTAASLRGTGLAQSLINTAEAFARSHGGGWMKLWTDTRFDRAHRFYEKQSYVRAGPLRVLNDLSNTVEFCYQKPLTGVAVERLDAAGAASAEVRLARIRNEAPALWRRRAAEVAQGHRVLFAGWHDGLLQGAVTLSLAADPDRSHVAVVDTIFVHPDSRRRGIGRALLEAAERSGRSLLLLECPAGVPAEFLCRAMGWTEYGRIPGLTRDSKGFTDAVLFLKRV